MRKQIYKVKNMGTMQTIHDALEILKRISLNAVGCVMDRNGKPSFTDNIIFESYDEFFKHPLADTYYKTIIKTVREINDEAGEYGNEALILICSMLEECIRFMAVGINQFEIFASIKRLRNELINELGKHIRSFNEDDKDIIKCLLENVDKELGDCIIAAFEDIGYKGFIQFGDSNTYETIYKCIEGHCFERGFMSAEMATDANKRECILRNPLIVITERPIIHVEEMVFFITKAAESKRPLLLIAEHIEDKPLRVMLYNKKIGKFESAAIQAPKYGTERKLFLSDIAMIVGATVITPDIIDLSDSIKGQNDWMFGSAAKVDITKERTVIYNGAGDKNKLDIRCQNLKNEMLSQKDEKNKEFIYDRVTLLSGKVGKIYLGGMQAEADAKKKKAERMVTYAREAVHSGIMIDASYALFHASNKIASRGGREDQIYKSLCKVLAAPLHAKLYKTGLSPETIMGELTKMSDSGGYDTEKGVFVEDMFKQGCIGSAGSLIMAVEKSMSLIGLLSSAEFLVIET